MSKENKHTAVDVLNAAERNGFEAVIHVTYNDFHGGYIASLLPGSPSGDVPNHLYDNKGECVADAIDWRNQYEEVTGKKTQLWAVT